MRIDCVSGLRSTHVVPILKFCFGYLLFGLFVLRMTTTVVGVYYSSVVRVLCCGFAFDCFRPVINKVWVGMGVCVAASGGLVFWLRVHEKEVMSVLVGILKGFVSFVFYFVCGSKYLFEYYFDTSSFCFVVMMLFVMYKLCLFCLQYALV